MPETWIRPSDQEVATTLVAVADLSMRRLFFNELENPEWLAPLVALNVFKNPPEPQTDPDGGERVLPWPEGDYLARIIDVRPNEVTAILSEVASSRNPWVQRTVISAARKLPAAKSKALARSIAKIVTSASALLNVADVMSIVETLSEAGEDASVRVLLKALFNPKASSEKQTGFGSRPRVQGSIDNHFYTELLKRAVPVLTRLPDIDGLTLVAGWLQDASRIQSEPQSDRTDRDASSIWRPSIAPHEQNSGLHELTDALIDSVRDTAVALGRDAHGVEVVRFLNGLTPFLLRRIGVEVAAQLLATGEASSDLVNVVRDLMVDPTLMGIESRPEYVRMAVQELPHLTGSERESWAQFVAGGVWQGTDDDMRRMAARGERDAQEVTEDEIVDVRERLLHRFLQPLAGVLPPSLVDRLASLAASLDPIKHAEFGSYMTSFTGPTSPKSHDELAAMTPDQLLSFLRSWRPIDAYHFGPSVEGLARVLGAVAESQPELLAAIAGELIGLGRSYARAALSGWAKAVPRGFVPTDELWSMVEEVVQQPDDGADDPAARDFDADDPVWRWAQRSAVDLIAAATGALPNPAPREEIRRLWRLLKPLTSHPDPTVDHENLYGGSNMDPLTLSLNTTRPAALRATIQLALTSRGEHPNADLDDTTVDILETLAKHVDGFTDPSLAVAAVIGEGLGRVWSVSHEWVTSRQSELFSVLDHDESRRARADVIVSVALRGYKTGPQFVEMMRPAILQVLTRRYAEMAHTEGWRESRTAADPAALHVVSAYVLQIVDQDDALVRLLFSTDTPVELIAESLGRIGWQIMRTVMDGNAMGIPPEYLNRARGLIDWRVDEIRAGRASVGELAQFFWWAQQDVFPAGWWLPILLLATSETGIEMPSMLGKPLADAAKLEPVLAVRAFRQLYGDVGKSWHACDLVQHAPHLLAAALRSGDEEAIFGANKIRDLLGRQGHFEALQELQQLLEGNGSAP